MGPASSSLFADLAPRRRTQLTLSASCDSYNRLESLLSAGRFQLRTLNPGSRANPVGCAGGSLCSKTRGRTKKGFCPLGPLVLSIRSRALSQPSGLGRQAVPSAGEQGGAKGQPPSFVPRAAGLACSSIGGKTCCICT